MTPPGSPIDPNIEVKFINVHIYLEAYEKYTCTV